ncbi:LysR family transcriptional regulator [bacterium]|nr:LysR family transcriptional regulator [bacterium]
MASKTALPAADDLFELRVVHQVASSGSFSAAARALGVTVSTATRAVQRLEARLGVALFRRSTHGLSLTEAGRRYAAHVAQVLAAEDAVRDEIAAAKDARRGTLRVTVPVFVAEQVLPRVVRRFVAAHPGVQLDVHASDDFRDVITDAYDLAIRLGPLPDSSLRARRLVGFQRVICAAPAWLAAHGAPRDPGRLAAVPCLLYGSGSQRVTWSLRHRRGVVRTVEVAGPVRSNNLELLVRLAVDGLGITRLPDWAVRDALASGALARVLPAWSEAPPRGAPALWAVHADDPGKDRLRRAFLAALLNAV